MLSLPCRVILLLTNSFDLEDGFLTASNLEQVKGYLASTYPSRYSEVFPQIKNCSLESELDTVRRWRGRRRRDFPRHSLSEKDDLTAMPSKCCPGKPRYYKVLWVPRPFLPSPLLFLNFKKTGKYKE